mmetsp:Transcript_10022/g.30324  ORF Transcript_10022/g.30324 Transcript_10022/m.30324 type:complete len:272 (-) Transcript_10022:107-922(-)
MLALDPQLQFGRELALVLEPVPEGLDALRFLSLDELLRARQRFRVVNDAVPKERLQSSSAEVPAVPRFGRVLRVRRLLEFHDDDAVDALAVHRALVDRRFFRIQAREQALLQIRVEGVGRRGLFLDALVVRQAVVGLDGHVVGGEAVLDDHDAQRLGVVQPRVVVVRPAQRLLLRALRDLDLVRVDFAFLRRVVRAVARGAEVRARDRQRHVEPERAAVENRHGGVDGRLVRVAERAVALGRARRVFVDLDLGRGRLGVRRDDAALAEVRD